MVRARVVCDGAGAEKTGKPGGWAFVILEGEDVVAEGQGAALKTSSLVMELTAAAEGLEVAVRRGLSGVELVTDCRIALDVATGAFTPRPPQYRAACERLRAAFVAASASARWVRAHSGERWNEEVDARAARARDEQPQTSTARRGNAQ